MSMSTHVIGFKPPDDKWQAMKKIWDACEDAGVDPPDDVSKFFEHETPDQAGVRVSLEGCVSKYSADMVSGFEINLAKVPKDVKILRFYNSW